MAPLAESSATSRGEAGAVPDQGMPERPLARTGHGLLGVEVSGPWSRALESYFLLRLSPDLVGPD